MNFFIKTFRVLALTINFIAGGLLLIAAYSYLIAPDTFALPLFFTLAFPVFLCIEFILLLLHLFIRPRRYAFLPLLFTLLSLPAVQNFFPLHLGSNDNGEKKISIISYNVQSFLKAAITRNGGSNEILDLLRKSNADIICLQEYTVSSDKKRLNQKAIEKALADYPFRHISTLRASKSGMACYSKYPITHAETITFGASHNSSCLYHIDIAGKKLTLINCHLESNHLGRKDRELYTQIAKNPTQSTELLPEAKKRLLSKLKRAGTARAEQARLLRKIADNIDGSVVICGDFNDTPQSYAYHTIRGDFGDAYAATAFGPSITYHESGFWFRIDHILHSTTLQAVDSHIFREKYSDHYPVQATLQWTTKDN